MVPRCYQDVVEHLLAGGLSVCPQASAGYPLNGPIAPVVEREGASPSRELAAAGPLTCLSRAVPQSRGAARDRA